MPKKAPELSALEVKRLKHPGHGHNATFAVGGVAGLLMQITPTDARSWILRTNVGDLRRNIGLGGYPDVPLAQARERAREAKDAIRRGVDPVEEKRTARAALAASQGRGLTFADAVERFLGNKMKEFSSEKHAKQWPATLRSYAVPVIGNILVADLTTADIQRVLEPIWTEKTITAKKLRGRIEAILAWATVAGYRTGDNPARWKGNLDHILPKPSKVAKSENWPAVALRDAGEWFADLQGREGIGSRALEFLALTAVRSGELRKATWDQIDRDARIWTVPAANTKTGREEHRVPLTDGMMALLDALPRFEGSDYVFPAARGGMLSDMALSATMRRMNAKREGGYLDPRTARPAVPHGLRSTFKDWATERTEYPYEMSEIALGHAVGSEVERAYRRGDMVERRRAMMAAWERFLKGEQGAKVVKMDRANG